MRRFHVLCSIRARSFRLEVGEAAGDARVELRDIGAADLVRGRTPASSTGLVYDLAPWSEESVTVLGRLVENRPSWPLLLYPPSRRGVAEILLRSRHRGSARARLQEMCSACTEILLADMRWLRRSVPVSRVWSAIEPLVARAPAPVSVFLEEFLDALTASSVAARATVARLVERLPVGRRTVERACRAADLPSPKRLRDWALLLLLLHEADDAGAPPGRVGERFGLNRRDVRRLTSRLTGEESPPGTFREGLEAFRRRVG